MTKFSCSSLTFLEHEEEKKCSKKYWKCCGLLKSAFVIYEWSPKGHLCLYCKEKPPLFVCSLCKNYWYCSTICQIKDWPTHQTKCSKEKPENKKTESVILQTPANPQLIKFPLPSELLTSVTEEISRKTRPNNRKEKSTNCLKCRQNLPYFLCSVCRNFWYCSHKCHHDHWEEHQKYCMGKLNTNVLWNYHPYWRNTKKTRPKVKPTKITVFSLFSVEIFGIAHIKISSWSLGRTSKILHGKIKY